MKAYNLHGINDFRFEEVSDPVTGPDSVVVKVHAAGICGSDIPRVYKTGTYHFPTIPGHEFSGEVARVGNPVNNSWLGKRVGVFPLIPCMKCDCCRNKKYEMCSNYNYLGSRTNGGFAEEVEVPVWNLIELPENVSFEQAAMLEPMCVAVHAIRNSGAKPSDTVVVLGLGTIGLFIAMFLKQMGFEKVIGVGNKDSQKDYFERCGFCGKLYADYDGQWNLADAAGTKGADAAGADNAGKCGSTGKITDVINGLTDGRGADVVFECVGKNETLMTAIALTAPSGTVQVVGNPASNMQLPKDLYWKILRRQLTVKGTWNSSYTHEDSDDWHYVLSCLAKEEIHPEIFITHKFALEDLRKGFEVMRDKTENYVKIMFEI